MLRPLLRVGFLAGLALSSSAQSETTPPEPQFFVLPSVGECLNTAFPGLALTAVDTVIVVDGDRADTHLTLTLARTADSPSPTPIRVAVPANTEAATGSVALGKGADGRSMQRIASADSRSFCDDVSSRTGSLAVNELLGMPMLVSPVLSLLPDQHEATIVVSMSEPLERVGERLDYHLYRTSTVKPGVAWSFTVTLWGEQAAPLVHWATHEVAKTWGSWAGMNRSFTVDPQADSGPFQFSILPGALAGGRGMILAHPMPEDGEHNFLYVAELERAADPLPREVTLVLDCSGSMKGKKFEQAQAAALGVLDQLSPGERFRIVSYATDVAPQSELALVKSPETIERARAYIERLCAGGNTNLYGALEEALRPTSAPGHTSVILFLTDGLPTVGVVDEAGIRKGLAEGNPFARRVYTFGLGYDVNVALLDGLAADSYGRAAYVRPEENVASAVNDVAKKLYGPVLVDGELRVAGGEGRLEADAVIEMFPRRVADVYPGEKVVVSGRTIKAGLLRLVLEGRQGTETRSLSTDGLISEGHNRLSYVTRIWAQRKIADLSLQIRDAGIELADPEIREKFVAELSSEIMRLSARHGVVTEYTAFLASADTSLSSWGKLTAMVCDNNNDRLVACRVGAGAVNQSRNAYRQQAAFPNMANVWLASDDSTLVSPQLAPGLCVFPEVETSRSSSLPTNVMAGGTLALRRGERWISSRVLEGHEKAELPMADRVVLRGSAEYDVLVNELIAAGRQALLSLGEDILFLHKGQKVRVTAKLAPQPSIVPGDC